MVVFRLTSYVIFYVLTVQLLTKKERLKRTLAAVAALRLFAVCFLNTPAFSLE